MFKNLHFWFFIKVTLPTLLYEEQEKLILCLLISVVACFKFLKNILKFCKELQFIMPEVSTLPQYLSQILNFAIGVFWIYVTTASC